MLDDQKGWQYEAFDQICIVRRWGLCLFNLELVFKYHYIDFPALLDPRTKPEGIDMDLCRVALLNTYLR